MPGRLTKDSWRSGTRINRRASTTSKMEAFPEEMEAPRTCRKTSITPEKPEIFRRFRGSYKTYYDNI